MDEQGDPVLTWSTLPFETRQLLAGKLAGLWGAASDAEAFDSWPLDKKQALLLLFDRLHAKDLWNLVKRVSNVYGEGGVGLEFEAWPRIQSTLVRREGQPENVAAAVLFFVENDFVTGACLPVDGGRTIYAAGS